MRNNTCYISYHNLILPDLPILTKFDIYFVTEFPENYMRPNSQHHAKNNEIIKTAAFRIPFVSTYFVCDVRII